MALSRALTLQGPIMIGNSDISRSFGASVDVALQAQAMSLVIGRRGSPRSLVQGVGGKVVLEISSHKVLASLPLTAQLAFRNHPELAFVGPVAIDPGRYNKFISHLKNGRKPNR